MSKLQNFAADALENPALVEGARRRGQGRFNPFNGSPYRARLKDATREGNRVARKAERRRDRGIAKFNRQSRRG